MQHHKLPARLLDWTRSPLVAAYFAVEEAITKPGDERSAAVIWCLSPHGLNDISSVGVMNDTPSIESGTARHLIEGALYGDESARRSAAARWRAWQSTLTSDDSRLNSDGVLEHADQLAVMAYESDVRMLVQQGAFTVHAFDATALDVASFAGEILWKLTVPAQSVAGLAREIELCGFGEAGIYPDLDHLGSELERAGSQVGRRP